MLNILFVGRMEKRKGFRYLLRAFAQIKSAVPNARLIVAGAYGKKEREPLVRFAREHGLRDVKFVGYISEEEKPRYYRSAHVFCAPSTGFESFGLVLLEAMAAGTPVVASDIAGYRTALTDGREGLLVPPQDPTALAQAIIGLLNDAERRRCMGEQGRMTASNYAWPKVARSTLDLYEECLEAQRNAARAMRDA